MSILTARLLGPAGVGVFTLLILLQHLGMRITDFGFSRAFRYYSANGEIHYYELKSIVFILGTIVGLCTILISLILRYLPINIWNDIDLEVYVLFLPTIFFFSLSMYMRYLLHGQLLINTVNISQLLESALNLIFFVFFVWYLNLGLIGVSLSFSICSIIIFIQLFLKMKKYTPASICNNTDKWQNVKKLWGYGQWSYYSAFIEYIFINFPVLLLKASMGSFDLIGYFNKAKGLSELPNRGVVPLSTLLFSYNAGSSADTAAKRTEILCRFSFWAMTVIYALVALIIKPLISFLYGSAFLPAAEIFYYLYPYAVFFVQSIFLSTAIAARGFNKDTFTIRLISLPIIIIVLYCLVTYMGIVGAAIAISFSFFVLWLQYALKYKKITGSGFKEFFLMKESDFLLLKNLSLKILS